MLVLLALINFYVLPLTPLPVPLLMPVCVVAAGCLEGGRFGAGLGIAAGLLVLTMGHGNWGHMALLCLTGWVCGLLGQYVLRQDLWGHLLCSVVLLGLWQAGHMLWVLSRFTAPLSVVLSLAGGEALLSLVWAFPIYGLNRFCCVHYGRIYHE